MIFIPFNVPSLKNKKVKGMYHPVTVRKYLQKIGVKSYSSSRRTVTGYKTRPNLFRESVGDYFNNIEYPAVIWFHFVRDSKRKFDFHNALHIVADLLVAHEFIIDDNMDYFLPYPMFLNGKPYTVDKNKPGVFIEYIC